MAGRGPAPKDADKRLRRNADPIATTTVEFVRGVQPPLPVGYDWPEQTRIWWREWGESTLSRRFTATDWSYLLDTALLHAKVWGPDQNLSYMAELRQRVAKVGATAEDRARLRIQFANADEADEKTERRRGKQDWDDEVFVPRVVNQKE